MVKGSVDECINLINTLICISHGILQKQRNSEKKMNSHQVVLSKPNKPVYQCSITGQYV